MLNLLIIDDNLYYSKNLINIIMENDSEYKIYKILINGKEAFDTIINEKEKIDIILLDLNIPKCNGLEILERIKQNNLKKYLSSIIVISGRLDMIAKLKNNPYLYTFINKTQGFEQILRTIHELSEFKKESNIENKIKEQLKLLKFSNKLIGTKYLYDAILLILRNEDLYQKSLKQDIYPIIAKKYNVSAHNIKCNINNATVLMNCECEKNIVMNYFGFFDKKAEAKPKQVIEEIINKIKNDDLI